MGNLKQLKNTVNITTVTVKDSDSGKRAKRYIWEFYNGRCEQVAQSWPRTYSNHANAHRAAYNTQRAMARWVRAEGLEDSHLSAEQRLDKLTQANQLTNDSKAIEVEGTITDPDMFTQAMAGFEVDTPVIVKRKTPNFIKRLFKR